MSTGRIFFRIEFIHRMCVIFAYNGSQDEDSDYSLIIASNRDEYYKRPSKNMGYWEEDPKIIGGRDLQAGSGGGSWLAISPSRKKLGALLNLPRNPKPDAKSRGAIVSDFVKSESTSVEYIASIRDNSTKYNDFVFMAIDFRNLQPVVSTYSNASDKLSIHKEVCLGFGNSLPVSPLKKVEAGKKKMNEICQKFSKVNTKDELLVNLVQLLKDGESHLPDPELELRRPALHKQLSSLFVSIPEGGYGTRTHTLILLTKIGEMHILEMTLQHPIDMNCPQWKKTEFKLNL